MKKTHTNVVDAEFCDDDQASRRGPTRSRPSNLRRSRRGSWVNTLLLALPLWGLRQMLSLASGIGLLVGELARVIVVPLARMATVCAAFTAMCLGVMYLGAYAIRGGVAETKNLADRFHASVTGSADALLALVPTGGHPDTAPRAIPVPTNYRPLAPGQPPEESVPAISRFADAVNLLLPLAGRYPQIEGLPRIDGDILELAGGHRMQALISEILPAIEQVESSGCATLVGDKGKAFGPYQVRREPCEDLADRFGAVINPADCNGNYELSEYVVRLYLGYWGVQHELSTGQTATARDLCRTWNGGPDQGPFAKTDIYWAKCQSHKTDIAQLVAR